ncbi:NADAR family protein [Mesorhizobium sp. M0184]|uniref:NADAR family protein n=1 Tax=unclassified Mesorhizobium TaxID=325217 RepID=UPI00333A7488
MITAHAGFESQSGMIRKGKSENDPIAGVGIAAQQDHYMDYDRAHLEAAFQAKAHLQFMFFWGHQPAKDGRITSSCFSQWWPAFFEVGGARYPTAEHWMMAEKARLFGDEQALQQILKARSPKQAKNFGREVRGFDEATWNREKRRIVTEGSFAKFAQNKALGKFLQSTGSLVIVEASPVDRVWGIGLSAEDDRAANPLLWRGENLLGFALMSARDRLLG